MGAGPFPKLFCLHILLVSTCRVQWVCQNLRRATDTKRARWLSQIFKVSHHQSKTSWKDAKMHQRAESDDISLCGYTSCCSQSLHLMFKVKISAARSSYIDPCFLVTADVLHRWASCSPSSSSSDRKHQLAIQPSSAIKDLMIHSTSACLCPQFTAGIKQLALQRVSLKTDQTVQGLLSWLLRRRKLIYSGVCPHSDIHSI